MPIDLASEYEPRGDEAHAIGRNYRRASVHKLLAVAAVLVGVIRAHAASPARVLITPPGFLESSIADSKLTLADVAESGDNGVTVTLSGLDAEGGKWSMNLSAWRALEAAEREYRARSFQPAIGPNLEAPGIGDESLAWGDTSILFRRGGVVVSVHGRLGWKALEMKAAALDRSIQEAGEPSVQASLSERLRQKEAARMKREAEARAEELPPISPAEVRHLLATLDDPATPPRQRQLAILELMRAGDPVAVPALIAQLDPGHRLLTRTQAAKALGSIGDRRAVPPLSAILQRHLAGNVNDEGEAEAQSRRSAVSALRKIADPSTIPLLKTLARSEREYRSVRELADVALGEMNPRAEEK